MSSAFALHAKNSVFQSSKHVHERRSMHFSGIMFLPSMSTLSHVWMAFIAKSTEPDMPTALLNACSLLPSTLQGHDLLHGERQHGLPSTEPLRLHLHLQFGKHLS